MNSVIVLSGHIIEPNDLVITIQRMATGKCQLTRDHIKPNEMICCTLTHFNHKQSKLSHTCSTWWPLALTQMERKMSELCDKRHKD